MSIFFFFTGYHRKAGKYLPISFIISLLLISAWWIWLNKSNGYRMELVSGYVKDLKAGYYLEYDLTVFKILEYT